jgi:hypothetical protein
MMYIHNRSTHNHINLLRFNKVYLYILTYIIQAIARILEHKLLFEYQIDCNDVTRQGKRKHYQADSCTYLY